MSSEVTTVRREAGEIMSIVEGTELQGQESYFSLRSPLGGSLIIGAPSSVVQAAWTAAMLREDDDNPNLVVRLRGITLLTVAPDKFTQLITAGWNAQAAFDRLTSEDGDCMASADEVEFITPPASPQ